MTLTEMTIEKNEDVGIKIRNPKSTDIFTIIRIIGKMKVKKELTAMANKITKMNKKNRELINLNPPNKDDEGNQVVVTDEETLKSIDELSTEIEEIQTELGLEVPLILMENLDKAEEEVEKFFAALIGVERNEYQDMDADITIDIFSEIKQNEKWIKVFTKALELLRR